MVVVPRGHARRRVHQHGLRLHPRAILLAALAASAATSRATTDADAHHLHVGHAGAHHDDRDVELGRPRDAHPDRRHRHRPPTPDRPAGRVAQRGPGPRRVPAPRAGIPPFIVGALVYDLQVPRRRSVSGSRSRVSLELAVIVSFGMRFIVNLGRVLGARLAGPARAVERCSTTVASGFAIPSRSSPLGRAAVHACCRGRR